MSDTNTNNKLDPFIWNEAFPEPNALFNFEHKSIKEIYGHADIVLDTNVLLIPLSTGSRSLEEVERIYIKLIARLDFIFLLRLQENMQKISLKK